MLSVYVRVLWSRIMAERVKSGLILVVDDDEINRSVFTKTLELAGFPVHSVATGGEAIDLCGRLPGPLALLIIDSMLTDGWGAQVAMKVREHCPDVPVLLTSGTPLEGWRDEDLRALSALGPTADFLGKPFQVQSLVDKVRRLTHCDPSGLSPLYPTA